MSAFRTHVMVGGHGRFWTAHHAAAVEVIGLAIDEYLTIELADQDTVCLTRTARPMGRLWPEQEVLLTVLFGKDQEPGSVVYLREPHQLPVAQRLMVLAQDGLLRDGMIVWNHRATE
ncbi:MAG: hypothetical protein KJO75_23775 [Dactylosporangium sp.]|nr:hypothetical protein [Dactylosporangium sp.]